MVRLAILLTLLISSQVQAGIVSFVIHAALLFFSPASSYQFYQNPTGVVDINSEMVVDNFPMSYRRLGIDENGELTGEEADSFKELEFEAIAHENNNTAEEKMTLPIRNVYYQNKRIESWSDLPKNYFADRYFEESHLPKLQAAVREYFTSLRERESRKSLWDCVRSGKTTELLHPELSLEENIAIIDDLWGKFFANGTMIIGGFSSRSAIGVTIPFHRKYGERYLYGLNLNLDILDDGAKLIASVILHEVFHTIGLLHPNGEKSDTLIVKAEECFYNNKEKDKTIIYVIALGSVGVVVAFVGAKEYYDSKKRKKTKGENEDKKENKVELSSIVTEAS